MILEQIQIEGFRSLKSVTWKPGRLNVLIGPNGGGKSNLLQALDLLRIAATGGLRGAILRMGGMFPLVWDGEGQKIRFDVVASSRYVAGALHYLLDLKRLATSGLFFIDERLWVEGGLSITPEAHGPETWLSNTDGDDGHEAELFRTDVRTWSIHHDMRVDNEAELRRATVSRNENRIESDGQNLIAVLHTLYTGHSEFQEFIDSAMTTAFPDDYETLIFPPAEDGRVQMRLKRKHRKRPDSTSDLSDGTLRFLLLLAILGSPDPAPLIAIDEPEAGLHPRMLPIIAAVAANTAIKSQVIFATQSPQFLDAFDKDDPLVVSIVGTNGAETILKTVAGEELKYWIENYSLGKFAFSGEAEAVL